MLIHNESYDDKIMRLRYEMLLMHSKTGQALGLDKAEDLDSALEEALRAGKFDSALEEASRPETAVSHRQMSSGQESNIDELSSRTGRLHENVPVMPAPENLAGRDTLIAEVAQRYAQAMDISGKHDTVFFIPA